MKINYQKVTLLSLLCAVIIFGSALTYLRVSSAPDPTCQNLQAGDFVQFPDDKAVYVLGKDLGLIYATAGMLRTWENTVTPKQLGQKCFDSLVPSLTEKITWRPGSYVVKYRDTQQLYVITPSSQGPTLAKISSSTALKLYGNSKGVVPTLRLGPLYWFSFTKRTADITSEQPHPGMMVNKDGIIYYVYTDNKLREVTAAGTTANKLQKRFTRKLDQTLLNGMQYGSKIETAIPALLDKTQLTAYPTDTGTPALPPTAPTLSAEVKDSKAVLNWDKYVGSNFKYYRLVRSETNTNPTFQDSTRIKTSNDINLTTFTDTKSQLNKTYYYRLCIQTTVNTYLCGNTVKLTITKPEPEAPAPTLSGQINNLTTAQLSWTRYSGSDFKSYKIVRSKTNNDLQYPADGSVATVANINTLSYQDSGLAEDTTYYYRNCVETNDNKNKCSNVVSLKTGKTTPPPPTSYGTTYYVRTDGGTAEQCDGKTNAAYTGNSQDCAWKHPFIALPPEGNAKIAGGDTLIINNGDYKMGYGASAGAGSCSSYYPWDCNMQAVPSGPSADKPTRILGVDYANGCSTKPQLYGAERTHNILDLRNSNNIEVQCLEITDRSNCVEFHSGSISCNRNNYPYGDWAVTGIVAQDSKNVKLKNLNIHGLANRGILAGRLTDWTIENSKINGNGWAGWDGDIDGEDSNSGNTIFRKVNFEWNGCGETYPGLQPTGCWAQTAGGYGDALGTGRTGGDWLIEDSVFKHNTSDAIDLYYHREGGTVTVRRTYIEGNAGEGIKTWGNTIATDNVVISNCGYFNNKSFTHHVDNCRGRGNAIALTFDAKGNSAKVYNNSVYSEGDCLMIAETSFEGYSGVASVLSHNNAFYAGTDYLQPNEKSCLFWSNAPTQITLNNDYDLVYQAKDNSNYCSKGTHNQCNTNPQFTSINNGFNLKPINNSPLIDRGTTALTGIDYLGNSRPQGGGVDIGAYEVK